MSDELRTQAAGLKGSRGSVYGLALPTARAKQYRRGCSGPSSRSRPDEAPRHNHKQRSSVPVISISKDQDDWIRTEIHKLTLDRRDLAEVLSDIDALEGQVADAIGLKSTPLTCWTCGVSWRAYV